MESGTLLEWFVKPGETVKRGDIVALVDTSKEIEVEIFEDGVIDELLVAEGARVPVGTVLARVRRPEARLSSRPRSRRRIRVHPPSLQLRFRLRPRCLRPRLRSP